MGELPNNDKPKTKIQYPILSVRAVKNDNCSKVNGTNLEMSLNQF